MCMIHVVIFQKPIYTEEDILEVHYTCNIVVEDFANLLEKYTWYMGMYEYQYFKKAIVYPSVNRDLPNHCFFFFFKDTQ